LKIWIEFFGLSTFENLDLENEYSIHKIYKIYIRLKFKSIKIDFKLIGSEQKWIRSKKLDFLSTPKNEDLHRLLFDVQTHGGVDYYFF